MCTVQDLERLGWAGVKQRVEAVKTYQLAQTDVQGVCSTMPRPKRGYDTQGAMLRLHDARMLRWQLSGLCCSCIEECYVGMGSLLAAKNVGGWKIGPMLD
jgi:hypothetical protein